VRRIAAFFAGRREPLALHYRVNAERLPLEHWLHTQGGYLLGEVCHFVDTICALGGPAIRVAAVATRANAALNVTLDLADGSVGNVLYTTAGAADVAKERLEVFGAGRTALLQDFAETVLHGAGRPERFRTRARDKGFADEISHFLELVAHGTDADAYFDQVYNSTLATLRAARSLEERRALDVS
jgi:polar amino acid transport system substrate-binding protein